jgi:hypothetical protein
MSIMKAKVTLVHPVNKFYYDFSFGIEINTGDGSFEEIIGSYSPARNGFTKQNFIDSSGDTKMFIYGKPDGQPSEAGKGNLIYAGISFRDLGHNSETTSKTAQVHIYCDNIYAPFYVAAGSSLNCQAKLLRTGEEIAAIFWA